MNFVQLGQPLPNHIENTQLGVWSCQKADGHTRACSSLPCLDLYYVIQHELVSNRCAVWMNDELLNSMQIHVDSGAQQYVFTVCNATGPNRNTQAVVWSLSSCWMRAADDSRVYFILFFGCSYIGFTCAVRTYVPYIWSVFNRLALTAMRVWLCWWGTPAHVSCIKIF